jgi:hypothetical protein
MEESHARDVRWLGLKRRGGGVEPNTMTARNHGPLPFLSLYWHRGRILGQNPDKSLKSFPPYLFKLTQPLTVVVKEKEGKPTTSQKVYFRNTHYIQYFV